MKFPEIFFKFSGNLVKDRLFYYDIEDLVGNQDLLNYRLAFDGSGNAFLLHGSFLHGFLFGIHGNDDRRTELTVVNPVP